MGMERSSAAITLISATLAGIFIYYSHPISQHLVHWMAGRPHRIVLATVENKTGAVSLYRVGESNNKSQPVFKHEHLYHLDQLIVQPGGTAVLKFTSGYQLKLTSNTDAIIQSYQPGHANAPVLLTLATGSYQLLSSSRGHKGDLFVAMDNQIFAPEFQPARVENQLQVNHYRVNAVLATLDGRQKLVKPNRPINAVTNEPATVDIDGQETLSDNYIERTMQEQAAAFRDCQLNSLRDDLTADGSLLFSITISPSGRIDRLGVVRDLLHNKELVDCTRSVIDRIQFQHFEGKPVTINYPIDYR